MRPYLLLILVLFSLTAISQRQFPSISGTVDVHLDNAYQFHQQKDSAKTAGELHIVQQQMASLNDAYPYYRGIVSLFLSFYDFNKNNQQSFRNQATSLLKNADHLLADSFASAFYNVMYLHYQHKRMGEWLALDSMFRTSIRNKLKQSNFRYLFADYAQAKLEEKEYFISNKLASYEYYMLMYNDSKEPMDDLTLVYVDWLITKGDLEQWLDLPYEYRHPKEYAGHTVSIQPHNLDSDFNRSLRDHDFKKTFNTLISRIKEIKEVCIEKNNYDQASVNRPLRRGYYQVYMEILNGFHSWAVNEHKEGQVILPLKSFLMLDLIPNEIENASIHKVSTEVTSRAFLSLVDKLSKVYHAVGNGQDEKEIIMQGLRVYLDKNVFSEDELFYAIGSLLENRVSAERLLRNYEGSLATSQSLKKRTSRPDSVSKRYMNRWELFMKARIEEVYTLVESGQPRAWDSLGKLLNETTLLDDGSSNAPIYSSKSWPHMQYLIALMKARKGDWWTTLLMESIVDMENLPTLPDLYYPVQLFYFKALWHKEKKIDTKVLTNLIFYTGRQLRHTFMMMSAEERMILYEQRLSGYFDVYHELLFSGMADAHPEIKDQLIAQSLSLKNLLADGNLIPNELLQKNQAGRSLESIEKLRALRQEVNLVVQQSKFLKYDVTTRQLMKDRIHIMWLELLEGAGMDSLIKLTDWKQIAAKLSTGQIYTETVRYNKWLSDSTAWYGAYAITSEGKMSLVKLYPESKIEKLLNDPAASQQTAAINVDGNRGNKILSKKGKPGEKKFKQGDVDKLAALILE
ncbi:MAG: hypothetical protein H0U44_04140, partial [Flavisolibacter sp.]|nr:hypothetical protein [Flavisolibacter sp.]